MLPPNLINQIHPFLNSDVELIISATRGSKKRVWWLGGVWTRMGSRFAQPGLPKTEMSLLF